jgi:hypothetical protein
MEILKAEKVHRFYGEDFSDETTVKTFKELIYNQIMKEEEFKEKNKIEEKNKIFYKFYFSYTGKTVQELLKKYSKTKITLFCETFLDTIDFKLLEKKIFLKFRRITSIDNKLMNDTEYSLKVSKDEKESFQYTEINDLEQIKNYLNNLKIDISSTISFATLYSHRLEFSPQNFEGVDSFYLESYTFDNWNTFYHIGSIKANDLNKLKEFAKKIEDDENELEVIVPVFSKLFEILYFKNKKLLEKIFLLQNKNYYHTSSTRSLLDNKKQKKYKNYLEKKKNWCKLNNVEDNGLFEDYLLNLVETDDEEIIDYMEDYEFI